MKLRYLYLASAFLGFVLPYSQFVPWIAEHHALNMSIFLRDLFTNRISAFFAMDVIVFAILLISFIQTEGKHFGMQLLWLPTIGTLLVGVSFGLPLFLYLRELRFETASSREENFNSEMS